MSAQEQGSPLAHPKKLPVGVITALLIGGLIGHVIAAWVNGIGGIAYFHHVVGFFFIAAITGLPIAALTFFVWPQHRNRAWVVFGVIQLAARNTCHVGRAPQTLRISAFC